MSDVVAQSVQMQMTVRFFGSAHGLEGSIQQLHGTSLGIHVEGLREHSE